MNYSQAAQCAVLSEEIYQDFSQIKFSHFPEMTPILINQEKTSTQSAMLFDTTKDVVYIIFRGSEEKVDWFTNFNLKKVAFDHQVIQNKIVDQSEKVYPYAETSQSGAQMHQGFVNAYLSVRDQIHDQIKTQTVSDAIVTGHSLGGALATLCAVDLQYWLGEQLGISSYTFGSPRVGNQGFSESFLKRVPNSYRFVYGMDIVPALPRPWQGYRHVEKECRLGSRFSLNFFSQRFRDHDLTNYITALKALA